jgi:hypothetical protein
MKKVDFGLDGILPQAGPPDDPAARLALIDRAVDAAKGAAHACHDERARECFEFALALLRESWIAESGQNARGAEKVIADVKWGLRLIAAAFAAKKGQR